MYLPHRSSLVVLVEVVHCSPNSVCLEILGGIPYQPSQEAYLKYTNLSQVHINLFSMDAFLHPKLYPYSNTLPYYICFVYRYDAYAGSLGGTVVEQLR